MRIENLKFFNNYINKPFFGAKNGYEHLLSNQANHRANPKEYEQDVYLGTKISEAREEISKIKEELKITTDSDKKADLKNKIHRLQDEKQRLVNELTGRHLKFAIKAAHDYSYLPIPFDDIVSSASLGIYKAAERYSPDKHPNATFLTYARHWIKQQILRDTSKDSQVRVPIQAMALRSKINNAFATLEKIFNRRPTIEEIAEHLNMTEKKVKSVLLSTNISSVSLDAQISKDDEGAAFSNLIPDENSSSQFEKNMQEEDIAYLRNVIKNNLSPKERYVIEERYRLNSSGANNDLVILEELSKKLNLTRERIRQIETQAIRKLRHIYRQEQNSKSSSGLQSTVPTLMLSAPEQSKSLKKSNLSELISVSEFIDKLSLGDSPEIKSKLINKLHTFSADGFKKLLYNCTSEKRRQILEMKYFKGQNLSLSDIARALKVSRSAAFYREQEGLKDIRRFLLEGDNIGYAFLKDTLCEDLKAFGGKKSLIKRVEKTPPAELREIMENTLLPKEVDFLSEKYSLNRPIPYGCKVKSNKEIAEYFNTTVAIAHLVTCKGIQRLKEYFSKPQIVNTNLFAFAQDATASITDEKKRKKSLKIMQEFSKNELDNFLSKILTPREITVVTKRYNLDKYDSPKMPLVIKDEIVPFVSGISTRNGIDKLEESAFEKIRKYFEDGIVSNQTIFIEKLVKRIDSPRQQEEIKNKLIKFSSKELEEKLKIILTETELDILKKRYNLDNEDSIIHSPTSRSSFFKQLANTMSGLKSRENIAMDKICKYFTVGLPSNIDLFAREIAQKASSQEEKNKIVNVITSKNIFQLQRELSIMLEPFEYQIISGYFMLDKFVPVVKEEPNIVDFAQKIQRTKNTVYSTKLHILKKLYSLYSKGLPSNYDWLGDMIVSKIKNEELKEKIQNKFKNMSASELEKIFDKTLSIHQKRTLIERYQLHLYVDIFKQPISMEEVASKLNLSIGTICVHENKAIKKLIAYFEETL